MSVASRIAVRFHTKLSRAVEKQKQITGCAKTAVKAVARKIGMGPLSIYRVLGGYGNVTIKASHHVALIMLNMGDKAAARFSRRAKTSQSQSHMSGDVTYG